MLVYILISLILTICYAFIMLYYVTGWKKLQTWHPSEKDCKTGVCIIIPARNEAPTITQCVQAILNQNYPPDLLEIIVVDDHSTDDTTQKVKAIADPRVKLLQQENGKSGKKAAIESAIAHTQQELIVTTDADCMPGKKWLHAIVSFYESVRPKMILGPVCYNDPKKFTEKFQALDFAGMVGVAASSAGHNYPHTCNGANLAYTKAVFTEVNGFEHIDSQASGDDMLLMQKILKKYPKAIKFLKSKDAIVTTNAQPTWKDFINQRIRWGSKASVLIDKKITLILAAILLFNISILMNILFALPGLLSLRLPLFQLLVKFTFEFIFLKQITDFLDQRKLMKIFIPSQIVHVFYIVFVGLLSNFAVYKWKGRISKKI